MHSQREVLSVAQRLREMVELQQEQLESIRVALGHLSRLAGGAPSGFSNSPEHAEEARRKVIALMEKEPLRKIRPAELAPRLALEFAFLADPEILRDVLEGPEFERRERGWFALRQAENSAFDGSGRREEALA